MVQPFQSTYLPILWSLSPMDRMCIDEGLIYNATFSQHCSHLSGDELEWVPKKNF